MSDHDKRFKQLLTTFFPEFLQLFFPPLFHQLDPKSLTFQSQETFVDVTQGQVHRADLVVQARLQEQQTTFLIHVENQATPQPRFNKRMFTYFARLHEQYDLPIYPIVLLSYDTPKTPATDTYRLSCAGKEVLQFSYSVIQLNQLAWQEFVEPPNPVAAALLPKMKRGAQERARVKLTSVRMQGQLSLTPAQRALLGSFLETYLPLSEEEQKMFDQELEQLAPEEQEAALYVMTSWERQGFEKGRADVVLHQLQRRFGEDMEPFREQLALVSGDQWELLAEALLDFTSVADLQTWLAQHVAP